MGRKKEPKGPYKGYTYQGKVEITHEPASISPQDLWERYISKRKPVVIDGLLQDDQFKAAKWTDLSYLSSVAGDVPVKIEPLHAGLGRYGTALARRTVHFAEFLDMLQNPQAQERGRYYLTTQYEEEEENSDEGMSDAEFPSESESEDDGSEMDGDVKDTALGKRKRMSDGESVFSSPSSAGSHASGSSEVSLTPGPDEIDPVLPSPTHALANDFPAQPKLMGGLVLQQCNLWLGAAPPRVKGQTGERAASSGTSSGLHHDFHDNLYVLLSGAKRFLLFPPSAYSALHIRGKVEALHKNGLLVYEDDEGDEEAGSEEEEDDEADDSFDAARLRRRLSALKEGGARGASRSEHNRGELRDASKSAIRADGLPRVQAAQWLVRARLRTLRETEEADVRAAAAAGAGNDAARSRARRKGKARMSDAMALALERYEQALEVLRKERRRELELAAGSDDEDDDVSWSLDDELSAIGTPDDFAALGLGSDFSVSLSDLEGDGEDGDSGSEDDELADDDDADADLEADEVEDLRALATDEPATSSAAPSSRAALRKRAKTAAREGSSSKLRVEDVAPIPSSSSGSTDAGTKGRAKAEAKAKAKGKAKSEENADSEDDDASGEDLDLGLEGLGEEDLELDGYSGADTDDGADSSDIEEDELAGLLDDATAPLDEQLVAQRGSKRVEQPRKEHTFAELIRQQKEEDEARRQKGEAETDEGDELDEDATDKDALALRERTASHSEASTLERSKLITPAQLRDLQARFGKASPLRKQSAPAKDKKSAKATFSAAPDLDSDDSAEEEDSDDDEDEDDDELAAQERPRLFPGTLLPAQHVREILKEAYGLQLLPKLSDQDMTELIYATPMCWADDGANGVLRADIAAELRTAWQALADLEGSDDGGSDAEMHDDEEFEDFDELMEEDVDESEDEDEDGLVFDDAASMGTEDAQGIDDGEAALAALLAQAEGEEHSDAKAKPAQKKEPQSFSRIKPTVLHKHFGIGQDLAASAKQSKKRKAAGKFDSELADDIDSNELRPDPDCPQPIEVHLRAGQMLYLPASWFHEVTSYAAESKAAVNGAASDKKKDKQQPADTTAFHMALNYWFHPPSSVSPTWFGATERDEEGRLLPTSGTFERPYHEPEVWQEIARAVQQQVNEAKAVAKQMDSNGTAAAHASDDGGQATSGSPQKARNGAKTAPALSKGQKKRQKKKEKKAKEREAQETGHNGADRASKKRKDA